MFKSCNKLLIKSVLGVIVFVKMLLLFNVNFSFRTGCLFLGDNFKISVVTLSSRNSTCLPGMHLNLISASCLTSLIFEKDSSP